MAEFYPLLFGRGFSLPQLLFFCCFSSPLCRAPVPARRAGDASHRLGGGLRPPPSPRELPRPRWAETFSLPANLAFGVSQKPKPPL